MREGIILACVQLIDTCNLDSIGSEIRIMRLMFYSDSHGYFTKRCSL